MEFERTISTKGQVVVPRDVRRKLGLKAGSEIIFELENDRIIIKKKISPTEFIDNFARTPKKIKGLNIKKIKRIISEQYEVP